MKLIIERSIDSFISLIEYKEDKKELIIHIGDKEYTYYEVESFIVKELIDCQSVGRHFNERIKNNYKYKLEIPNSVVAKPEVKDSLLDIEVERV